MLRFPEAVAVGPQGDVYVADQLGYVVQKLSPAGALETEWGSYGGGHGQFGPIGGLATDAAGDVYVVDSSHDRIEKFDPNGAFITAWGHRGEEPGQFNFGSSQDFTKPPGGGIAVAGNFVFVADSGNDRIERFNLQGGEAMAWGTKGSALGQFSYPRGVAANESEVIVSDDDNYRIEQFNPKEPSRRPPARTAPAPASSASPTAWPWTPPANVYVADDINHRVVKLTPQLAFAGAWGGFGSKPGQLAFPRALASDPAGDTYVADTANDRIEVFDPDGELPAHDRHLRPRTRRADRAQRPGRRPDRQAAASPTRTATGSSCSLPAAPSTPGSGPRPAGTPRASTRPPASASTRRVGVRRRPRQRPRGGAVGRWHLPVRTRWAG